MNTQNQNLEAMLSPKAVAIVGATDIEGKVGWAITKNILELGYQGKVFLVNPKYDNLFNQQCYKSLDSITESVDVAIMAIPVQFVLDTIKSSADRIKNFVIISAGFAEIGEEGKAREEELKKIIAEKNINILGPNCLGFIMPHLQLNASFASGMPNAGNVAFVSQSGALAVALMDIAEKRNLGFSAVVSLGNKTQIDEYELLEYLEHDERTQVIAMYLENIIEGKRFVETASRISIKKPIVVLKAGLSTKAQKAIASHTGALAGEDRIVSAALEKAGVIRVNNLEEFFDVIMLAAKNPMEKLARIKNIAVVTNAGGAGVITADAFQGKSVELSEFGDKTKEKLKTLLPAESSVENPIDLLGDAQEDRYKNILKKLEKEETDSVIAILTPQGQTPVKKIASALVRFNQKTEKICAASFIGGKKVEKAITKLEENNVACYPTPERAVAALDKIHQAGAKRAGLIIAYNPNSQRAQQGAEIISRAKQDSRKALSFLEAKELCALYGIPTVDAWEIGPQTETVGQDIAFPCVAKIDSDKVLHKTDKKALVLGIKNEDELRRAIKELRVEFPEEKIIIQPMLAVKTELIAGIKRDPSFGPVVLLGLGGIYTEIFKKTELFVPPLDKQEIQRKLAESSLGFLFVSTRGQNPHNLEEISGIILELSELAQELSEIAELDVNPLLAYNNGEKAIAVDVKIILKNQ